jgi:hypothetical protein
MVQSVQKRAWLAQLEAEEAERLRVKDQISKYGLEDWKRICASRNPELCHPSWAGHFGFLGKKWSPLKEHPLFTGLGLKKVEKDDKVPFALRRLKSYQLMVMKNKKPFEPGKRHPSCVGITTHAYQIPVHRNHPSFSGYDYKVDGREAITEKPKWDFANMFDPDDKVLPCFVCRRPNGLGMPDCPRCGHREARRPGEEVEEKTSGEDTEETDEEAAEAERLARTKRRLADALRAGGGLGDLALLGKSPGAGGGDRKKKKKKKAGGSAVHNDNGPGSIKLKGGPNKFNFAIAAQVRLELGQQMRELNKDGAKAKKAGLVKVKTKEAQEEERQAAIAEAQSYAAAAVKAAFQSLKGTFTTLYVKAVPVGGVVELTVEEADTVEYLYFLYRANAGPDGISNKTNVYIPTQRGIFRMSEDRVRGSDMWAEWAPADFTMKEWGFTINGAKAAAFQCCQDHDDAARRLLIGFLRRNLAISEGKLLTMMDMRMRRYPDQMPTDVRGDAMQGLCVHMFEKIHEMQLVNYAAAILRRKQAEEEASRKQWERNRDKKLKMAQAARKAAAAVAKLAAKAKNFGRKKKKTAAQVRLEQNAAMLEQLGGAMGSDYSESESDEQRRLRRGHQDGGLMRNLLEAGDDVRDIKGGVSDRQILALGLAGVDDRDEDGDAKKKKRKKKKKKKKAQAGETKDGDEKKKKKKKKRSKGDGDNAAAEDGEGATEKKTKKKKKKKKKLNGPSDPTREELEAMSLDERKALLEAKRKSKKKRSK